MHLTPRSLGLAAAAAFTGCTLFGILTSIDLVPAATDGTPSTAQPTPDATQTPASPASPPVTASPSPVPQPSMTPSALAAPIAAPTAVATSTPTPRPADSGKPTARPSSTPAATPRSTAKSTPRRTATPAPGRSFSAPAPAPRPRPRATTSRTAPTGGWAAPALQVGTNTITVPRLTSGAKVSVTVGCSPSAGCTLTGTTLTIAEGASVTVTWSAPARSAYTAWSVSRAL